MSAYLTDWRVTPPGRKHIRATYFTKIADGFLIYSNTPHTTASGGTNIHIGILRVIWQVTRIHRNKI